jgi:hypothetical protein
LEGVSIADAGGTSAGFADAGAGGGATGAAVFAAGSDVGRATFAAGFACCEHADSATPPTIAPTTTILEPFTCPP